MAPQEIILSGCSSEASGSGSNPVRSAAAPAIIAHDLLTATHLHSFKTSNSSGASTSYVPTQDNTGGALFSVQEGKALVNIWAWQKDQLHLKIHLPEKMSCFTVSPNGCWAVGGSPTGQIYLWEMATGLLLSSFTAHYRAITTLSFTSDSHIFTSSSLDSAVHVYLVSRLVDEADAAVAGKPYGVLSDHTLAIRDVKLGKTAGSHGGRCWTASEDGTVKVWSIAPFFELLTTFNLPSGAIPTCLAVDPHERFFYAGTQSGNVHSIPLFRHRQGLGDNAGIEAVGGGGQGSAPVIADLVVVTQSSPITALSLSLSSDHLLVGTQAGEIHMYALPSHQLLRTISTHSGSITHLSTLLRPADFVGVSGVKSIGAGARVAESWPIMEIKPFERQRATKQARETREVALVLGPRAGDHEDFLQSLRPASDAQHLGLDLSTSGGADTASQIATLESENKRLRANLEKAIKVNDRMWNGVVQLKLAEPHGDAR